MTRARRFLATLTVCLLAIDLLPIRLVAGTAEAGQFVQFKSGETQIVGYLARPAGPGPFPAVVLLHGCGGFHASMMSWTDQLAAWGYAALAVDSFGPRGVATACGGFAAQSIDAYQALHYLAQKSFVRADAVALMGFSLGASATLTNLEQGSVGNLYSEKFRAGIAFYPVCAGASGVMTVPTLILIGDLDDWTPAGDCMDMVAGKSVTGTSRPPGDRANVKLIVYPGARHAFDVFGLRFSPDHEMQGHRLQYNEAATKDSILRVRTFLQAELKI